MGRPPLRSHEEIRAAGTTGPAAARKRSTARLHRSVPLLVIAVTLCLTGCTRQLERGWEPTDPNTTNHTSQIMSLWINSWIAALAVGVLVWGLILWVMVAYRRRRDETGFPPQVRYHIPLEILYTVLPLMMVAVLFYYTARDDQAVASVSGKPDKTINVVGKQWSWDFNYIEDNVYDAGVQAQLNGTPSPEKQAPTLYLPVNRKIQFVLTSRDVIHSFWVPAFLFKMDVFPGVVNRFELTPQRIGTFKGKCAELCGEYHSEMLFTVKVVSQADYDAHVSALRAAGKSGALDTDLGRSQTINENGAPESEASNS